LRDAVCPCLLPLPLPVAFALATCHLAQPCVHTRSEPAGVLVWVRFVSNREERVVGVMTHGWLIGQMLKKNKMPFFCDFAILHIHPETLAIAIVHDYVLKGKVW
jgi:hypothetical protein